MKYEIKKLDKAGLRRFGLSMAAIVAILFGVLVPWVIGGAYRAWPWAIAGVFVAWALVAPATLDKFYVFWMKLGLVLGRIVNPLVLGIVFLLTFVPMGLIMRLLGKDPMRRALIPDEPSYRIKSLARSETDMERPY